MAGAELVDGAPRKLGETGADPDALALIERLEREYPGAKARIRETGRYMRAEVIGVDPDTAPDIETLWPGDPEQSWRLAELSFLPKQGVGPAMVQRYHRA